MIWVFGLITGLVFDMPTWWWVTGFILGVIGDAEITQGKIKITFK